MSEARLARFIPPSDAGIIREKWRVNRPSSLRNYGFYDRKEHNLGISHAAIESASVVNPTTKNTVYFTTIDYPITGYGLGFLLAATSPVDTIISKLYRKATIDGWRLPDEAEAIGDPTDRKVVIHNRHMQLPSYREFMTHRLQWMKTFGDTSVDTFYDALWQGNFGAVEGRDMVIVSANGVTARLEMGTEQGSDNRQIEDVICSFPDEIYDRSMIPLLAWEKGKDGRRRFLSQAEALKVLPESMRKQGLDVMLGRVVLGYLQPEVTDKFAKEMALSPIPTDDKAERQRIRQIKDAMKSTEMAIWVSLPNYSRRLLSSSGIAQLEENAAQNSSLA